MATPTNYYVDPGSGTDTSGQGTTDGTAYATVQYALNDIGSTHGRDTTNGDQINVKAGTADTLTAALSMTTYGTADETARITIRGYTSTANDGGIGEIGGGGSYAIISNNAYDYMGFVDMKLGNCGSNAVIDLDNNAVFINCEIHTTTASGISCDATCRIIGCHFHNIGAYGITGTVSTFIYGNAFFDGTNTFERAINSLQGSILQRNIISLTDTSAYGIYIGGSACTVSNNSIYNSSAGTNDGIYVGANPQANTSLFNNIVEGFNGVGGVGINANNTKDATTIANNAVYNCSTDYSLGDASYTADNEDTTDLGATPFAKSGSNTFANRYTYFAPSSAGNVKDGALQ